MLGNLSFYLTLNSGHIPIALFCCLSQQKDLYHEPGCKNCLIIAKKKKRGSGISEEILKAYDGNDSQKPSLMAIVSQIYDVSQRWYNNIRV
ncbi:hypothetical protein Hanom_Chr09g00779181 [Helianthus anomalus]